MEKLSRCGNSVDGKIMEVWELWRWHNYGGVGTLQMDKCMEVWELCR